MLKTWIVVALLLFSVSAAFAQSDIISPELLEQIEQIEDFTSETRGLEELKPVERVFPSRQDAVDYVLNLYDEAFSDDEARRLSLLYQAFELLPPGTDYLTAYLDLLSAQLGGFYEPETEEMNVLLMSGDLPGDELPLLEQIVYAHEFTHALQDQHFGIDEVQSAAGEKRDHQQAILSLIEGDATVVMNLYTQEIASENPLGTALQLLAQGIETNTLTIPPGTPPVIESELLSAYLDGSTFVAALLEEGGWDAVNAAYSNLPQSTEQILHPEKYLVGEAPMQVALAPVDLDEEWETIWDDTMGEFYLREYLKTQLPRRDANRAAAGWGGDRYQVFYNEGVDQLAWVMRLEWDTADEAREFTAAYDDFLQERFEELTPGELFSCWNDDRTTVCVYDDADSHVLASAPTLEMASALVKAQIQL